MATRHESTFTITRITYHIPKSFDQVLSRLESSIKQSEAGGLAILGHVDSKKSYESATNVQLGPHGFMHFAQINHGAWMLLYGVHIDKQTGAGKQSMRIVFGNPQTAITMLQHDINAGLFVPVEALIVEREDGSGTDVVQVKPSSLIVGSDGSKELQAAAEKLDEKLEALWKWISEDE